MTGSETPAPATSTDDLRARHLRRTKHLPQPTGHVGEFHLASIDPRSSGDGRGVAGETPTTTDGRAIPPTGFEPVISCVKGRRPGPLDHGGGWGHCKVVAATQILGSRSPRSTRTWRGTCRCRATRGDGWPTCSRSRTFCSRCPGGSRSRESACSSRSALTCGRSSIATESQAPDASLMLAEALVAGIAVTGFVPLTALPVMLSLIEREMGEFARGGRRDSGDGQESNGCLVRAIWGPVGRPADRHNEGNRPRVRETPWRSSPRQPKTSRRSRGSHLRSSAVPATCAAPTPTR